MQLTNMKLLRRTRELESKRFVSMQSILPMSAMDGNQGKDEVYLGVPDLIEGKEVHQKDMFIGYDSYLWMQKEVTIPPSREGMEAAGVFDFGKTGGGHNTGFESLLYVDGKPYQGVDTNHPDVIFESLAGQTVTLTFMLWTGLNGGPSHEELIHQINQAEIGYLHKATDEFYYFSKAIYKTLNLLRDDEPAKQDLSRILDHAYLLVNWDEDKFHDTIGDALTYLLGELDRLEKNSSVTVHCVGHTHIDVAWLWRLKHTREKTIRSFSTVLRLMEEFDEYIFLQSQPQLYQYIKHDNPEMYEKLKARIQEGKWEADGGMWLEADCNITSGESLVRQFLYGINFMKDELGADCEYLWLPDVFGYSWALPQILKQCNIDTFATTKISWNQFNTMPHDLFTWRGIDGSEVMTYFINTPEVGMPEDSRYATYNGQLSPRSVLGSWRKFKDKELSRDTLISYGYGDGGGGVNRNMLKMRRAMDKLPGLPNVKNGKAGDFFKKMHQNLENASSEVPVWDGELYLEYHRGTYTSQAFNKMMNRYAEFSLAETEWLSGIAKLYGGIYDKEALYEAWTTVLRNQFHDIIPGSSIREVYEDSAQEYFNVINTSDALKEEALDKLVDAQDDCITLYNFASFARNDLAFIDCDQDGLGFTEQDGAVLSSQRCEGGYFVRVPLAPLSFKTIMISKPQQQDAPIQVNLEAKTAETPVYSISWDENGNLNRVFDKEHEREVLKQDGLGNVLEVFEDKPLNFDNWDIDIFYTQKRETFQLVKPAEITESGAVRTVIRFVYRYNLSNITQDMVLYPDSRRIDFETQVSWHETNRLLKTAFSVDIRSTKATYDIQYGHVERPTHHNTSWDYARFEVVGHKWADLSEANYGVSLLNNCKYGYSIRDNVMKLSLLKSTKSPDEKMDMGDHRFIYSLLPHTGSVTEGDTIEQSHFLNLPVSSYSGKTVIEGNEPTFQILGEEGTASRDVVIDAVKEAEKDDCLVVRLHECRGGSRKVSLDSRFAIESITECNLLEQPVCDEIADSNSVLAIKPFEIKTLKVKLAKKV